MLVVVVVELIVRMLLLIHLVRASNKRNGGNVGRIGCRGIANHHVEGAKMERR
jgi:hypothetical protein